MVSSEDGISCAACGIIITDRYYLLAVDREWHIQCLKCCLCEERLDSHQSCFSRDGNIYCKHDYYRLVAVRTCARCQTGIFANDLVMKAKDFVYHLSCFTCFWCNNVFSQGDYFGLKENGVYCQKHYELVSKLQGDMAFQLTKKRKARKRRLSIVENDNAPSVQEPVLDSTTLTDLDERPLPRGKRRRTSFKHYQLRAMKSFFTLNQNPDSKDLKQLAQKTELTKRVLQVWFQNARAKWRRNNNKIMEIKMDSSTSTPKLEPVDEVLPGFNEEAKTAGVICCQQRTS